MVVVSLLFYRRCGVVLRLGVLLRGGFEGVVVSLWVYRRYGVSLRWGELFLREFGGEVNGMREGGEGVVVGEVLVVVFALRDRD